MTDNRRTFLRQLVTLPLIGGGVTLLGNPTAVAIPASPDLLDRYTDWLAVEYGECLVEREGHRHQDEYTAVRKSLQREWCRDNLTLNPRPGRFLKPPSSPPSTRAALVLSAVGCDWRRA